MENFDLKNFLIENKLTTNSKLLSEQVDEVNWKGLAAGAAMALGTLGAQGQEAPKPRDYQKSIDSLKTVTDKTPQEKRALTADFVKKRNAQRLAPIEAAQEKRIQNWINANPGSTREDYFKAHERSDKFCVTGDDSGSKKGGSCGAATSLQKALNAR
jgi:hypothetical protein